MELGYDNSTDNPRNPHVPPRARAHRRAHRRRDGQRDVRAAPGRRARQGAAARAEVSARDRSRRWGARLVQPRQHARRARALCRGDRGLSSRRRAAAVADAGAREPGAGAPRERRRRRGDRRIRSGAEAGAGQRAAAGDAGAGAGEEVGR